MTSSWQDSGVVHLKKSVVMTVNNGKFAEVKSSTDLEATNS